MYKQYYVYIVSNKNDTTLYTGVTDNIERRIMEHKSGLIPGFTKRYNCNKLVYYEVFSDVNMAIDREKQIKGWKRERKEELIDKDNKERYDLFEKIQILRPAASE